MPEFGRKGVNALKFYGLLLCLVLTFFSPAVVAERVRLGVGFGTQYGGMIGVRASYALERVRLNAGLGMLGYTSSTGFHPGYSVGINAPITQNQMLGVHVGTTELRTWTTLFSSTEAAYRGVEFSYSYYFSGLQNPSWQLGAAYVYGKATEDHSRLPSSSKGPRLVFGYQF